MGSSDSIAQSEEPCFYELKHFVECAKKLGDTKFCQDFDKVLKTCKEIDLIKMFKLKKCQTGFGDQVTLAKKKNSTIANLGDDSAGNKQKLL